MIDVRPFIRQAWLDDLRSGKFQQAHGTFREDFPGNVFGRPPGFCLGEVTCQRFNPEFIAVRAVADENYRSREKAVAHVLGVVSGEFVNYNDEQYFSFEQIADIAERQFRDEARAHGYRL